MDAFDFWNYPVGSVLSDIRLFFAALYGMIFLILLYFGLNVLAIGVGLRFPNLKERINGPHRSP